MSPTRDALDIAPSAISRSEIVRFPVALISKTRDELLPLIFNTPAPGPTIVVVFPIAISPVASVMIAGSDRLNIMVSPELALAMLSLSDPGPLSAVLVTVRTEKAIARRVITPVLSVHRAKAVTVAHTALRFLRMDVFICFFSAVVRSRDLDRG
jgi:hypothetical protein